MGALTKKQPVIERQLTESDCAVWAIKAMCFQLNVAVPPANRVRHHVDLENGGTSIRSVKDALEQFGIMATPVKGQSDSIEQAPLPAIAMVRLDSDMLHYIVVLDVSGGHVRYLDPALGGRAQTMKAAKFALSFTGYLVLCEPKPGYVNVDLGDEPNSSRFVYSAWRSQLNSIFALAIGEVFQLFMLLVGILMLRSFFGSSMFGMPNFWFLSGMGLCAVIYLWIASLHKRIQSDIKSKILLSLFGFATELIGNGKGDAKGNLRETSSRCVKAISAVSRSLGDSILLPGNTASLVLFIVLLFWIDVYAASFAIVLAVSLPLIVLWAAERKRVVQGDVSRARDANEIGFVYLLANGCPNEKVIEDMPWNQLAYCDAIGAHQECIAHEGIVYAAVGRMNIFAGLLIGGLQHASLGLGHTIAVFFLLGIFTSVVSRWANRVATLPECKFQVRSMLDLFSDFRVEPVSFADVSFPIAAEVRDSTSPLQSNLMEGLS